MALPFGTGITAGGTVVVPYSEKPKTALVSITGPGMARMVLQRYPDGDRLEAQFNPTEFTEELETKWAEQEIVGMSHVPLQYTGTGNLKVNFDLHFNARMGGSATGGTSASSPRVGVQALEQMKRVLHSFMYPVLGTDASRFVPTVLFVWPQHFHIRAVVRKVTCKNNYFNHQLQIVGFQASVSIEEFRTRRLTSSDILAQGFRRP